MELFSFYQTTRGLSRQDERIKKKKPTDNTKQEQNYISAPRFKRNPGGKRETLDKQRNVLGKIKRKYLKTHTLDKGKISQLQC